MALSTPNVLLVVRLDAFKKPLQHALNTVEPQFRVHPRDQGKRPLNRGVP